MASTVAAGSVPLSRSLARSSGARKVPPHQQRPHCATWVPSTGAGTGRRDHAVCAVQDVKGKSAMGQATLRAKHVNKRRSVRASAVCDSGALDAATFLTLLGIVSAAGGALSVMAFLVYTATLAAAPGQQSPPALATPDAAGYGHLPAAATPGAASALSAVPPAAATPGGAAAVTPPAAPTVAATLTAAAAEASPSTQASSTAPAAVAATAAGPSPRIAALSASASPAASSAASESHSRTVPSAAGSQPAGAGAATAPITRGAHLTSSLTTAYGGASASAAPVSSRPAAPLPGTVVASAGQVAASSGPALAASSLPTVLLARHRTPRAARLESSSPVEHPDRQMPPRWEVSLTVVLFSVFFMLVSIVAAAAVFCRATLYWQVYIASCTLPAVEVAATQAQRLLHWTWPRLVPAPARDDLDDGGLTRSAERRMPVTPQELARATSNALIFFILGASIVALAAVLRRPVAQPL